MQDPFADIPYVKKDSISDPFADIPYSKKTNSSISDYLKSAGMGMMDIVSGYQDETNNFPIKLANFLMPKSLQIPTFKTGEGTAYNVGKGIGDIGTFVAGGEGLEGARAASEAIPYIGKLAEALGGQGMSGVARRALGSSGYGAVQNPQDAGRGALEGAALSGAMDLIPMGIGGAIGSVSPKKYMNSIYDSISDALGQNKSDSKALYGSIMNKFGHQPIDVKDLDPEIFKTTKGLKKIYSEFSENPTLENAHRLQSQLGSADRSLKGKDVNTWDRKNGYKDARDTLLTGIYESLGQSSPEAQAAYSKASQHYRENVIPFQMTSDELQKIVRPKPETVSRKLEAITKRQEYPSAYRGETRMPMVPEDIRNMQTSLDKKIRNRNMAQLLSGATLGSTLLHSLGMPLGEELGAVGGAMLPGAIRSTAPGGFSKSSSIMELAKSISNALGGNAAKKSALALLLGEQ